MLPRVSALLSDASAPRGIACLRIAPSALFLPLRVFAPASPLQSPAKQCRCLAHPTVASLCLASAHHLLSQQSHALSDLIPAAHSRFFSQRRLSKPYPGRPHRIRSQPPPRIPLHISTGADLCIALCCPDHCQCQAHHSVAHRVLAFRSPCLARQGSTLPCPGSVLRIDAVPLPFASALS